MRRAQYVCSGILLLCCALGCNQGKKEVIEPASSPASKTTTPENGGDAAGSPSSPVGASPDAATSPPDDRGSDDTTAEKASIAILDFTFHSTNRPGGHVEFNSNLLTDRLVSAIAQTRKFRIVERQRVADLLKEFTLTEQGFTSKDRAVQAGEMTGADYLVLGSISHMAASPRTEKVPYTSDVTTIVRGRVAGTVRVVDSRTGEIVASWPAHVEKSTRAETASPNLEGFYESMQTDLASQITRSIVDTVYPVKVASVGESGDLFLNAGKDRGYRVGDVIGVFESGPAIVDPDTKERIGAEEIRVGKAKITEMRDRLFVARLVESTKPILPGMVAHKLVAPSAEKGTPGNEGSPERPALNW